MSVDYFTKGLFTPKESEGESDAVDKLAGSNANVLTIYIER